MGNYFEFGSKKFLFADVGVPGAPVPIERTETVAEGSIEYEYRDAEYE